MGKEEHSKCSAVLNQILDNPESTEFRHPVDWKG